jgi:uncharacterized membrane protein
MPMLFRWYGWADKPAGEELNRLGGAIFAALCSPAAVVAVGSGTALVFAGSVFTPWLFTKLAVVGALVALHVRTGYVLRRHTEMRRAYAGWRMAAATMSTSAVLGAILVLVLAKPRFEPRALPHWLTEPGSLQPLLSSILPMP